MVQRRTLWSALIAVVASLLAGSAPAHAHWADLSVAEIVVRETMAQVTLVFPTALVREADDNRDGELSAYEVRAHKASLEAALGSKIGLSDGATAGVIAIEPAQIAVSARTLKLNPRTHSTVRLIYTWPQPIRTMQIRYALFLPGVQTASCLATILHHGQVRSVVFRPEAQEFGFTLGGRALWREASSFILLGIEHILTGYDHMLFLISLLMLGGGLRYLIKVVSAFTIAHSVTLTLAVLNVISLPPRWVESAIALSIVYVAAENLWRKHRAVRSRWVITFAFGLIHGLGFASILKEIAIPQSNLALSLVTFNLGVEVGQIAVVATAFALLQIVRAGPREMTFRRFVSAGAVTCGLIWFVQRAILPL
jgi:hydrogenase/urease accessory protein HupE